MGFLVKPLKIRPTRKSFKVMCLSCLTVNVSPRLFSSTLAMYPSPIIEISQAKYGMPGTLEVEDQFGLANAQGPCREAEGSHGYHQGRPEDHGGRGHMVQQGGPD